MKKILALVLAVLMVVSLAACGAKTETAPAATEAPATEAPAAEAPAAEAPAAETEARVYNIGICQLFTHDALDAATKGFMDALTEKLGDNVKFDLQNAQLDVAMCSTIATGFVANDVDLIMANATPALLASIAATDTIPILGTSVTDFADSMGIELTAEGATNMNVSGTSDGLPAKLYADCVMELVPTAKKVSIVYCSAEPNSVLQSKNFMDAMAESYPDVVCTEFTFSDSNDIQSVVTAAVEDCDAVYIPTDNTAASNMTLVAGVCEPINMPVICGEENMCKNGGLATVSLSYYNIGYACGEMAYEILVNGADISAMPIGITDNPVKSYNPDYAEAIGFEMPAEYTAIVSE